MQGLLAALAALLLVVPAGFAAEPGSFPSGVAQLNTSVPVSRVPAVGTYDPTQPFHKPVAKVDGVVVYPPLFPSLLKDPVDRALVLRDYDRNHFILGAYQLDNDFLRYQHAQFHGIDALRDNRLQREHATLDDYRRYVTEEVKIHTILYTVCQSATTWAERAAQQDAYLARLRHGAVIKPL